MAEYNDIIREQQQGKYAPIYLLQGEEPFFIDNIIRNVEINALDDAQKSFNQYIMYGKDISITDVLNVARKYPMMGERQVVIVKEAQEMKGWNKEDLANLLISYLENPLPTTILVFGHKYKSLDKRTKLAKAFEKNAVVMSTKKLYENQVPSWLSSYAKALQVSLTEKAVMILAENIGNNLQRLSNEIEKLRLNIKEGQQIDEGMVQKFVGISKDYNAFELQNALAVRNQVKAYKIIDYFAANPSANPLVLVLGGLYAYFTKLLLLHHQHVVDKNQAAKVIGVHPFLAGEYIQAKKNYSLTTVTRNLQMIHEADLQSKGIGYAPLKEGEILKELVFKLLH